MNSLSSIVTHVSNAKLKMIRHRFSRLYGGEIADSLLDRFYHMLGRYGVGIDTNGSGKLWDESDAVLITYPDMVLHDGEVPLETLRRFCAENLKGAFSTVHLLPFFPWSSDDGFSVIDYRQVDERYGNWEDVRRFSREFDLMFDLVLNHCSAQSAWFLDYVSGIEPARNYILEGTPDTDLSTVVRPRSSPPLMSTSTRTGERHVWTTFSPDQIDLDWRSPDLLFEFLDFIMLYLTKGCRILRLDAVAFLWKEAGTNCLHLPETHEVVKLIRNFLEIVSPETILLTETNVPHEENISYFGCGDEAHAVYQFSLPPLLLHGLLEGTAVHLTQWAASLEPPPKGCAFLNFTASHDGIGVRPLEGILTQEEILALAEKVKARDGLVSMRSLEDGSEIPYELNATFFGALSEPDDEATGQARFLCSQAVAFAMRGIPAVYFHSLTATPNYLEGVEETGRNRTINRRKWKREELAGLLDDNGTATARVFDWCARLLRRRASSPAFHPDASQATRDFGSDLFVIERTSLDETQTVLCVFNFTNAPAPLSREGRLAELFPDGKARDLVGGSEIPIPEKGIILHPYQALWLLPR
ncbi:MAG: alpha-amylase family glycosyl hydrolase [Opitutales bacterium]